MTSEFLYSATLQFPFDCPEHALIAARSLGVDGDLKPNESVAEFTAADCFLVLSIRAKTAKFLKKAITTIMPSVELVQQTVQAFAVTD
jgi:tRNA threonylcarbamoyladenosine modification (KEOPS) complex  Pcc1 subunit